jgi:hypothetical protein
MSEDTTKDMSQKYDTKPTIETVLERMNEMRSEINGEINKLRVEMSGEINKLRSEMHVGFDRVESIASGTRAEFLTLRADFRELKQVLIEHIPALKT